MSFADYALDVLTTPQAAALVGRHESSLKHALADGKLPGVRTFAGWQIRREDVMAWDQQARRYRRGRAATWNHAADMLAAHGPATAAEIADLLGIHAGNARKHLAILAKKGRARRGPDGQWALTNPNEVGQSVAC
jgi:excisionase family DNA binding protein